MKNEVKRKISLEQEQKNAIIQLCGVFLIVFCGLCFLPTELGQVLSVPFTFLFGLSASFVIAFLLTTGFCMLIFKRVFNKYLKFYQILLLLFLFLFILALLTLKDEYSEMTFATSFKEYLAIYDPTKSYSISGENDLLSLNGGMLGYMLLGIINRFTDMTYIITKIVVIALTSAIGLGFIVPLTLDIVSYFKREYKTNKAKRKEAKENKKIQDAKIKELKQEISVKNGVVNSVDEKELKRQENEEKERQKALAIYKRKQEKEAKKEQKLVDKRIKKELKETLKEQENEEVVTVSIKRDAIIKPKEDDLLETTEINISGDNFTYSSTLSKPNEKLRNLLSVYDDEIYDRDFKELKVKNVILNEIETSDINETTFEFETNIEETETVVIENKSKMEENVIFINDDNQIEENTVEISNDKKVENDNNYNEPVIEQEVKVEVSSIYKQDYENLINYKREKEMSATEDTTRMNIEGVDYKLPPTSLLVDPIDDLNKKINEEEASIRKDILKEKLAELGVQAKIESHVIGPAVTRFEVSLASGVRVNTFTNLIDDLKLALGVSSIRIESPIPGKIGMIGLEVPNANRTNVFLKELISCMPYKKHKLYVPIGKDIAGSPLSFALCDMPHTLISGATLSGKSVCLNTIITSLLMNYRPDEVRMVMVDPKRVELLFYKDLPHLLCPIISEVERASVALEKLCIEMDKRFSIFASFGVKTIAGYNDTIAKKENKLPFIIVVIDEFADLMLAKNHQVVEEKVQRIAQLGRAAGIHLIIATQRPDVNIIPGTIKNNLPCRMTFRLSSSADSRTVIDVGGAEKLLNNGDMLLLTPDFTGLRRVQGVFISDEEIESVCNFIKEELEPDYDPNFLDLRTKEEILEEEKMKYATSGNDRLSDEYDPLYEEIKKFVIKEQKASSSLFERKFRIGYGKAARYLDRLEEEGIVGPENGSKGREVLVNGNNY